MASVNFSTQIKHTMKVKRMKISEYGKSGEISASGLKYKFYQISPGRKSPYMELSNLSITWAPTVSHLLEGCWISISIRDSRGCKSSKNGDLLILKKRADMPWELSASMALSIPTTEISAGLPIVLDVTIPDSRVKSQKEIGRLDLVCDLVSTTEANPTTIGPVVSTYKSGMPIEQDQIIWRGMKVTGDKSTQLMKEIQMYMSGDATFADLYRAVTSS